MSYNPDKHHRQSIRLREYDYAQAGAYFITVCTYQRECIFGTVRDGHMECNSYAQIVHEEWMRSAQMRREIELVMPNHVHGIVIITNDDRISRTVGAHGRAPLHRKPRSLGSFIARFKSATTKRINQIRGTPGLPVWQRNYYEHIVRDENDLNQIRKYILENPLSWEMDENYPKDHH